MIEEEEETSVITVLRIGCDRSANTLFIQYRQEIGEENREIPAKTKRIRLKKCTHEDPSKIVASLKRRFPLYLAQVPENYITDIIMKLYPRKTQENNSNSLASVDEASSIFEIDLNKCPDEVNQKAKQIMEKVFEAKRLKPGDEGYEWDKRVDFSAPTEDNEWDED